MHVPVGMVSEAVMERVEGMYHCEVHGEEYQIVSPVVVLKSSRLGLDHWLEGAWANLKVPHAAVNFEELEGLYCSGHKSDSWQHLPLGCVASCDAKAATVKGIKQFGMFGWGRKDTW